MPNVSSVYEISVTVIDLKMKLDERLCCDLRMVLVCFKRSNYWAVDDDPTSNLYLIIEDSVHCSFLSKRVHRRFLQVLLIPSRVTSCPCTPEIKNSLCPHMCIYSIYIYLYCVYVL